MSAITKDWTTCWKLTDANHQTRNNTQWGEGVTNPDGVKDGNGGLCSGSFYHGYADPYMAIIMNPEHANISNPVLWEAQYRGLTADDNGLKFGATEFRTVRIISAPVLTETQLTAFAIYAAALCDDGPLDTAWHEWAVRWLTGEDRTWQSADAASASVWASASARARARASACAWARACASASASASASARARAWAWASTRAWAWASTSTSASASARAELFETAIAWALVVAEDVQS